MKRSKKYRQAVALFDANKGYNLTEAAEIVKKTSYSKFDGSVDLAVRLGVDPRQSNQMVRGVASLPHGIGKEVRVLVLTSPDKEAEARAAGAEHVGLDDYIAKLEGGWMEIDVIICSPSPFLNAEARRNLPAGTRVHETTFEEFQTDRKYDLILFAESFQYVKMEEALTKAMGFLRPGGQIVICDVFRLDTPGKSPIGGGHYYSKYLQAREARGLVATEDVDITPNIAPTFDLVQDLSLNLLKPAWENLLRIFATNHPYLSKFVNWRFRKRLKKMNKHFEPTRNGSGFLKYKTYRLQVLKDGRMPPNRLVSLEPVAEVQAAV